MSTYLYLRCEDHNPPLLASGESGQHLYDLDQIRSDIANRAAIAAALDDGMEMDHHFRRNTAWFLSDHPHCAIGIRDEYGVDHPTNPT